MPELLNDYNLLPEKLNSLTNDFMMLDVNGDFDEEIFNNNNNNSTLDNKLLEDSINKTYDKLTSAIRIENILIDECQTWNPVEDKIGYENTSIITIKDDINELNDTEYSWKEDFVLEISETEDELKQSSYDESDTSSSSSSSSNSSYDSESSAEDSGTEYYSFSDCAEIHSFDDYAHRNGENPAASSITKILRVVIERNKSLDSRAVRDANAAAAAAKKSKATSSASAIAARAERHQTYILDYFSRSKGLASEPGKELRGSEKDEKSSRPMVNTLQLLRTLFSARVPLERLPSDSLKKLLFYTKYNLENNPKTPRDFLTFYCETCEKTIPRDNHTVMSHQLKCQRCDQLLRYQCRKCFNRYQVYGLFRNHVYSKCQPTLNHYCLLCNFNTPQKKDIYLHLKRFHDINESDIKKQYVNKSLVEKFIRQDDSKKKQDLMKCNNNNETVKNKVKSTGINDDTELNYCCAVSGCNYKCDSENIIIEHVKKKHEQSKDFTKCEQCGKLLKRNGLTIHKRFCKGVNICSNYTMIKSVDAKKHDTINEINSKPKFDFRAEAEKRCLDYSSNKPVKIKELSNIDDFRGILEAYCPKCDKKELTVRFRQCRKCKTRLRFICYKCRCKSSSKAIGCGHIQNLFNSFKYQCDHCSKVFAHSINVVNHMKYCSSQIFYKCNFCSYESKSTANLKAHSDKWHKHNIKKSVSFSNDCKES